MHQFHHSISWESSPRSPVFTSRSPQWTALSMGNLCFQQQHRCVLFSTTTSDLRAFATTFNKWVGPAKLPVQHTWQWVLQTNLPSAAPDFCIGSRFNLITSAGCLEHQVVFSVGHFVIFGDLDNNWRMHKCYLPSRALKVCMCYSKLPLNKVVRDGHFLHRNH